MFSSVHVTLMYIELPILAFVSTSHDFELLVIITFEKSFSTVNLMNADIIYFHHTMF